MSPSGALRLPRTASPEAEDGELARRAAAGDRAAFETLYDRYEQRAYNLCYRITGSAEDAADATQETFVAVLERLPRLNGRELNFGAYVMAAARNASYDAIARRKRVAPAGDIPDSAVPVGAGEGPDRPERHALRAAHQEQIRAANESLPPRQREVLALRELGELSYDDVAGIMGMNRNSVAQLISRARINLRDNLRHTALGSFASASPLCERALPLLALRQDGALDDEDNAGWLAEHLAGCGTCRVRIEAMEEAGVAYRLWLPLVPALWLRAAVAEAAERVGAEWSAPRRSRHLRLAAAGGALLAIAFLLAPVDRAQTPTRVFPAPAASAAPAATAAPPAEAEPVERRAPRPRTAKERRAPKQAPAPVLAAVTDAPAPAAPADSPAAADPTPAAPAEPEPEPARRRAAERPREAAPPPAPEPAVADPPPPPADPPAAEPVDEPLCPGANCPGDGSLADPPCPTAMAAAACPPPRPPVLTCTRCEVTAPRSDPAPGTIVVTRP